MEALKLMALYWGVMLIGYLIASRMRHLADRFGFIEKFMTAAIVALVFIMGLKMGANEEVIGSLGTIGIQSVLITVTAVGGSMVFVTMGRKLLHLNRKGMMVSSGMKTSDGGGAETLAKQAAAAMPEDAETGEKNHETSGGGMGMTLLILCFVAVGMAAGYLAVPRLCPDLDAFQAAGDRLLVIGLCVLLALIGFSMGLTGEVVNNLKHAGLRVALIPVLAVAGSLAGGVVYGLVSPLTIREAMAVSAGFGWYTLAPTLLTEAGHAVAGAVSFLHNVIREVLGIIIIPLAAKKIGYLECTAIPGVAAMDICLPIVEKSCNQETVVYSFLTGLLMSASVPVLVPLLIG